MALIADTLNARPGLQRRLFFLARRFVAGETVESAIAAVTKLNASGLTATLDFLGEDVVNEREAAQTTSTYLDMIDSIVASGVDSNVSVKLSAIGQAISEDLALANLEKIVAKARPARMFVRLDMEGSATVDSTYHICDRARATSVAVISSESLPFCTLRVLAAIEVPIWPGITTEHLTCGALSRRSLIKASVNPFTAEQNPSATRAAVKSQLAVSKAKKPTASTERPSNLRIARVLPPSFSHGSPLLAMRPASALKQ